MPSERLTDEVNFAPALLLSPRLCQLAAEIKRRIWTAAGAAIGAGVEVMIFGDQRTTSAPIKPVPEYEPVNEPALNNVLPFPSRRS